MLVVVSSHTLSTISKSPTSFAFSNITWFAWLCLPCFYVTIWSPFPSPYWNSSCSPHFSSSSPPVLHSIYRQRPQSTHFDHLFIYTLCLPPQYPYPILPAYLAPIPPTNPNQSHNAALHPLSPRPPPSPHYHPRPWPSGYRDRHPPYPIHNRSSIQKHHYLHLPIRHCPAHPRHEQIHLDIDTNKVIRQGRPHRLSRPHSLRRPKRSPPQARGQRACQRLLDALPAPFIRGIIFFCFELHICWDKGRIS